MLAWVWASYLVAYASAFQIPNRDYNSRQYFIVEFDSQTPDSSLNKFITSYHETFMFEHPVRGLEDLYVFSILKDHPYMGFLGNYNSNDHSLMKRMAGFEDHHDALVSFPSLRLIHMLKPRKLERRLPVSIEDGDYALKLRRLEAIDSSQLPAKEVSDKLDIQDPLFLEQWHLVNTLSPGNDLNVKNVWYEGIRGQNITVAIVDDGVDYESKDLADNFNAEGLWDFNGNGPLPKPILFNDYHGTRCAGEVAGAKNDFCGIGVAYEGKVAGIRILSGKITSEEEAAALIYGLEHNQIYSCSWGPTDNGRTLGAPEKVVQKAFIKGIQEGRERKGALYVFASGNGGRVGDQCNFDGYTNSIYSLTVSAIDYAGNHPSYAEACSAVMVVAYSSGSGEHIHTTDFKNKCTTVHGGTSAAAPLAAAVLALALQANPELTWRDMQYVAAKAAIPVNEGDGDYQETALGEKYSHKYGFGKLDAEKIVEAARNWKNVKPQAWYYGDIVNVNQKVLAPPDADSETLASTWTVLKEELAVMNLERIEHVTVRVNIGSQFRGKIDVKLISPTGIVSKLAWFRDLDNANSGLVDWTFMSVAHFGEDGRGEWRLEVFSGKDNEIHFQNWQLRFFGESIDAEKSEVYDLDKDYVQVKKDRLMNIHGGSSSPSSLAQQLLTLSSELLPGSIESSLSFESMTTTGIGGVSGSSTSTPTSLIPSGGDSHNEEGSNRFFSMGQYFMGLAVIGFVAGIIMMKWSRHQSSSRRRRGEYEFDVIPGEDYSDSDDDTQGFELTPSQEDLENETLFANTDIAPEEYDNDLFLIGDEETTRDKHDSLEETERSKRETKEIR